MVVLDRIGGFKRALMVMLNQPIWAAGTSAESKPISFTLTGITPLRGSDHSGLTTLHTLFGLTSTGRCD